MKGLARLLASRKFVASALYLIGITLAGLIEPLQPHWETLAAVGTILILALIGGVTFEDAVKAWAERPRTPNEALHTIVDEVVQDDDTEAMG